MSPPVAQLAIAYGAGLWVGLVFLIPTGAVWILACLAASAVGLWGWRGILVGVGLVGVATGAAKETQESAYCSRVWEPGVHSVVVQLHDQPGGRMTTTGSVVHSADGCEGTLRLRMPTDTVPGGSRLVIAGQYRGRGTFRVERLLVLGRRRAWRFALRDAVGRRIRSLYGTRAPLVEAIILGRRDDVDPQLRRSFVNAGIAHLLAISGLHVGVLAGWIVILLRVVGGRRLAWSCSAWVVWCYVLLLGFPAPATRAAAFITILGIARVRQRHPPPGAVLAVALTWVLAVDPSAATSVGAWLSAAAVWGTRAGTGSARRFRLVRASLGATLATAPITAYAFGSVAPIGVFANLVAVPLAGVAVPGLFLSLLFGDLFAGGTALVLAVMERLAFWCAQVPGGHLVGVQGIRFAAPWVAILSAAIWLRARRPSLAVIRRGLMLVGVFVSWGLVAFPLACRRDRAAELVLSFLDVGQGDAVVLRTPGQAWVLIDGGPRVAGHDAGRRVVLPFLRRQGVGELSAVVVSHGDADHLGGIPAIVSDLAPNLVVDPGQPIGSELYLEYLETLDRVGSEWRAVRAGDMLEIDSVQMKVLHPSSEWINHELEPNENSVVLRVTYGCFTALLAGDIGWRAESLLLASVGEADLLKVGHHGSAGGTTDAWLGEVKPRAAVISVGSNNYGHPSPATLGRLKARGAAVFRTDRGGTVTVRTNGSYFQITQDEPTTLLEALRCLTERLLRSKDSSSSKRSCIRRPPVNLPSCSTTSRWPRK
jgi:competence protein ComEC